MAIHFEDESLQRLILGHQAFRQNYYEASNPIFKNLINTASKPSFLVITSMDSCVDPAILMNCSPSELLVQKNLANLIPAYVDRSQDLGTTSALEFAVNEIGVPYIILLGHSHCSGIKHLLTSDSSTSSTGAIEAWLANLDDAKQEIVEAHQALNDLDQQDVCVKLSLLISLRNLHSYPFIASRLEAGSLSCHAWYFDVENGLLQVFDQASGEFALPEKKPLP